MDNQTIVNFIIKRTQNFLIDEANLTLKSTDITCDATNKLTLKNITAIQGINSTIGLFVALSFDDSIIEKVCETMTEGLDISEEEKPIYLEETAGEILNIIVGNATSDFQTKGHAIMMSPPIIIKDAKSLIRHKNAHFYTANLQTDLGDINLYVIGPRDLFDHTLNYKEV